MAQAKLLGRWWNRIRAAGQRFGLGRAIALGVLLGCTLLRLWDPLPLQALRLRVFDFYQRLQPRVATAKPVVIVDIDEASLRTLGQWPWPRSLVADLVEALARQGALVVAFDVIFAEPDRTSAPRVAESLRGLDAATKDKLLAMPSNEDLLAKAFKRTRVVVGQSGVPAGETSPSDPSLPTTGFGVKGPNNTADFLVTFPGLLRNVPELEKAASGRGLLTIWPEQDGIVRRVPLAMRAAGALVPSLSLEMLRVVTGSSAILVKTDPAGVVSLALPGFEIPTDQNAQLWVHFASHDPARYVSAKDVLAGTLPPGTLANKLVIIGTSAVGLLDIKTTPVDASMPGVEVHAQVLESVLTKAVLTAPNWVLAAELLLACLVGVVLIALAPLLGAVTLFVAGGVMAALIMGLSWYLYSQKLLLLDATYPLGASFGVYLTLLSTNYLRAQMDRSRIRSAFNQYLSPALVEQLAQSPEKLVLGGEERRMTILFSDVRGFTTIAESYKRDPQGLTSLMNRFLTPLTNAIIGRQGTIDKYMGDAIMAFWNAPLDDPQHEVHACEAALAMLSSLAGLNEARRREAEAAGHAYVPIAVGVGLNTGLCVVGNMGSDLRFDYSVLGDSVNLASRLEGQSKAYGVQVILGSATAEAVRERFAVLEIDLITVKGKTEPEHVFTLLGGEDMLRSPKFRLLADLHQAMLAAYRAQRWDDAATALATARAAAEGLALDALYDLYADRIDGFREAPPGADWNGVIALQTK
ncbi:MAG: adenylate/guanylate cyclase domain-containing protein [Alsobacter sp.]